MLGRKRAAALGPTGSKHWAVSAGAAFVLATSVSNCSFPEYDFDPSAGGTSGAGGLGLAGANGGSSSGDGGEPDTSGGGGTSPQAGAGAGGGVAGGEAAGAAGAAGADCAYPTPLDYPAHCFDHALADGETGVDCGGGQCSPCAGTEACVGNADCLSSTCTTGACVPVLGLQYTSIVGDAFVRSPKFVLTISYSDPSPTTLEELTIRYYFNHNGVTEPLIGLDSQATIDPGGMQMDVSAKVQSLVRRYPLGPASNANGRKTDSYLEIGFTSPASVTNGTKLVITQDIVASSTDELFDQASHYSFINGSAANAAITVYRDGKRVWGVEPPMVAFPECAFAGGVNLNGETVQVDGESITAEAEQQLTFAGGSAYANSAAKALPAADAPTTTLLTTARTLSSSGSATWAVPNGKYWAYAWLTSAASADSGTLSIQDNLTDKFYGLQKSSGAGWGLVGPYLIDVSREQVALTATGIVHVAGLKLYRTE